jgi:hypothetical protein
LIALNVETPVPWSPWGEQRILGTDTFSIDAALAAYAPYDNDDFNTILTTRIA